MTSYRERYVASQQMVSAQRSVRAFAELESARRRIDKKREENDEKEQSAQSIPDRS